LRFAIAIQNAFFSILLVPWTNAGRVAQNRPDVAWLQMRRPGRLPGRDVDRYSDGVKVSATPLMQ
jgi:hypothetical protein